MKLEFRMHRPEDEDSLVEFWNQNSGWGTIDKTSWEAKFKSTPLGPASFALALDADKGDLIAQFGFIPSMVSVFGEDVRAYRPVAIMIRKDIREEKKLIGVPKLILQLYTYATKQLEAQGIQLIHMVPDHRWARLFKMVPAFKVITFPLYTMPLPLPELPDLTPGFSVRKMDYDDQDIDDLWAVARLQYSFMVVRDRRALSWKNGHRAFMLWGLYEGEKLAGLFTAYLKDKKRKWQICDLLYDGREVVLKSLILAACTEGQKAWDALPEAEKTLREVELFPAHRMEAVVRALGFEKVRYKFSLVVQQLDKNLPKEIAQADHWYVSPNE